MLPRSTSTNPVVLSYYAMRRMVGYIALALPFALAAGYLVAILLESGHLPHPLLERSISDYYYTPMRDYYVGSLCAIAAFLACSRGYDLHDEVTGYFAAACVLGVACCPSFNPHSGSYTRLEFQLGLIHTAFAALMYLMLSYICIFLFRKSSPAKPFTRRKRDRNRIYAACGFIMVACMIDYGWSHHSFGRRTASPQPLALLVRSACARRLRHSLAYQGRRLHARQAAPTRPRRGAQPGSRFILSRRASWYTSFGKRFLGLRCLDWIAIVWIAGQARRRQDSCPAQVRCSA